MSAAQPIAWVMYAGEGFERDHQKAVRAIIVTEIPEIQGLSPENAISTLAHMLGVAQQNADKVDANTAFHAWFDKRGVWPRLTYLEIFEAGYAAAQPYHDDSAKAEAESFDLRTRARLYKEQHAKIST